jgi:hypothetical protein
VLFGVLLLGAVAGCSSGLDVGGSENPRPPNEPDEPDGPDNPGGDFGWVTPTPVFINSDPAWSPDGDEIAYVHRPQNPD